MNSRLSAVLDVLAEAGSHFGYGDHVVILGDLVDTDKPSPQVLAAVMRVLDGWRCGRANIVVMKGNHDSSTPRLGDNALGPFAEAGYTVIEEPCVRHVGSAALVLLPFRPDPPSTWVRETLDSLYAQAAYSQSVLIGSHFGLADEGTAEYMRESALAVEEAFALCATFNSAANVCWLSGDWHGRKVWERDGTTVAQVGALVPTGFDNPGLTGYGSLWTFGDGRLTCQELAGPRFVKYRSARAAIDEPYAETCTLRYAQVTVKAEEMEAAREELEAAVAAGKLAGFELHSDRNEAVENAGETAAYVATATSFDAALERAVERLELPSEVNRGEVLRRAKQRMAQGKAKGRAA